jgi:hypothetical protein
MQQPGLRHLPSSAKGDSVTDKHDEEIASLTGATIERVEFRNDWAVLALADGREAIIDWRSFIITYPTEEGDCQHEHR